MNIRNMTPDELRSMNASLYTYRLELQAEVADMTAKLLKLHDLLDALDEQPADAPQEQPETTEEAPILAIDEQPFKKYSRTGTRCYRVRDAGGEAAGYMRGKGRRWEAFNAHDHLVGTASTKQAAADLIAGAMNA